MSNAINARTHANTMPHPAIEFVLWCVWRALSIVNYLTVAARETAQVTSAFLRSREHAPYIAMLAVVVLLSIIPACFGH